MLPNEQSLAGALFQTMTQVNSSLFYKVHQPIAYACISEIGTALGVTVSTIVYNRVVAKQALDMGVIANGTNSNVPRPALLNGYKAAEWTSCAFGVVG